MLVWSRRRWQDRQHRSFPRSYGHLQFCGWNTARHGCLNRSCSCCRLHFISFVRKDDADICTQSESQLKKCKNSGDGKYDRSTRQMQSVRAFLRYVMWSSHLFQVSLPTLHEVRIGHGGRSDSYCRDPVAKIR